MHRRGAHADGVEAPRASTIDGIAIRDRPEDVAAFLAATATRSTRIGADAVSPVQIALGSSGVPETFVVDGRGIIRYQHIGPIDGRGDLPLASSQAGGTRDEAPVSRWLAAACRGRPLRADSNLPPPAGPTRQLPDPRQEAEAPR